VVSACAIIPDKQNNSNEMFNFAEIGKSSATLGTRLRNPWKASKIAELMLLQLEKTLCFQTATFPPLQIFANFYLAESIDFNGLSSKKFGNPESWRSPGRFVKLQRATKSNPTRNFVFPKAFVRAEKCWPDSRSHFGMAVDLRLIALLAPMGLVPAMTSQRSTAIPRWGSAGLLTPRLIAVRLFPKKR
jgi:hypothetical protein